ncbi:RNA-directed DNA polymerase [Aspergillus terreus]|uniref:RNA-directed DNA polymerase n=1 Tax=Aspergillus terreus TaxID=33178 RepID=A0A5M3YT49_ASPTE|nr:hypothetical protein ATETN484_0002042800 [Aspergillus terreus]GFF15284.1 RNA-directed DNA polymerase [Aspergillus terreus]
MLLYRMHDDLWFCGEPEQCVKTWEVLQKYARITGLDFNYSKTGCVGRFFRSTFGEPAFCFGRPHVDAVLATYAKLQNTLFDNQGQGEALRVTEFLRQRIKSCYGEFDVPDAFFFLPEELGGLGLRNPFVPIMLVRGKIGNSPIDLCDKFKKEEIEDYVAAKKAFYDLHERARLRRLDYVNREADSRLGQILKTSEMNHFMSFEEYTRFREVKEYQASVLLRRVDACSGKDEPVQYPDNLETKWLLNLYADELLAKFGGFDLVDKKFLPVGVLNMVKGKKVKWQMVL